jgi:hypothetical protein
VHPCPAASGRVPARALQLAAAQIYIGLAGRLLGSQILGRPPQVQCVLHIDKICRVAHLVCSLYPIWRFRVRIVFSSQANPFYSILFRSRIQSCFNGIPSPPQTRSSR